MHTSHAKFRNVSPPPWTFFFFHLFAWISNTNTHHHLSAANLPVSLEFTLILILRGLDEFAFGSRLCRHNKYLSLDCFACVWQQIDGACVLLCCFGTVCVCRCVCLCTPGQRRLCLCMKTQLWLSFHLTLRTIFSSFFFLFKCFIGPLNINNMDLRHLKTARLKTTNLEKHTLADKNNDRWHRAPPLYIVRQMFFENVGFLAENDETKP